MAAMTEDALPDDPGTFKAMLLAERARAERLGQTRGHKTKPPTLSCRGLPWIRSNDRIRSYAERER